MSSRKGRCVHCGQVLTYPAEGEGQTIICPVCARPILLSQGDVPPAQTPALNQANRDERHASLAERSLLITR